MQRVRLFARRPILVSVKRAHAFTPHACRLESSRDTVRMKAAFARAAAGRRATKKAARGGSRGRQEDRKSVV